MRKFFFPVLHCCYLFLIAAQAQSNSRSLCQTYGNPVPGATQEIEIQRSPLILKEINTFPSGASSPARKEERILLQVLHDRLVFRKVIFPSQKCKVEDTSAPGILRFKWNCDIKRDDGTGNSNSGNLTFGEHRGTMSGDESYYDKEGGGGGNYGLYFDRCEPLK